FLPTGPLLGWHPSAISDHVRDHSSVTRGAAPMISIGSSAPDFTLPNQHDVAVTLSQLRGSPVVLIFFPFAFSPVCTNELCYVQDHPEVFETSNAKVLGISTDSSFALDAFARQESYDFELLSDFWPHGAVSRRFG